MHINIQEIPKSGGELDLLKQQSKKQELTSYLSVCISLILAFTIIFKLIVPIEFLGVRILLILGILAVMSVFSLYMIDKIQLTPDKFDDLESNDCHKVVNYLDCPDIEFYRNLVIQQCRKFKVCEYDAMATFYESWEEAKYYKKLYLRELK